MRPYHENATRLKCRDKGITYHAGRYSQQFMHGPCRDKTEGSSTRRGAKDKIRRARKAKKSSVRQFMRNCMISELSISY